MVKIKSVPGYKSKSDRKIVIETDGEEAFTNAERWMEDRFMATNELLDRGEDIENALERKSTKEVFEKIMSGDYEESNIHDCPLRYFFFGYANWLLFIGWERFLPSYKGPNKKRWKYTLEQIGDKTVYFKGKPNRRKLVRKFDKWFCNTYVRGTRRISDLDTKNIPMVRVHQLGCEDINELSDLNIRGE